MKKVVACLVAANVALSGCASTAPVRPVGESPCDDPLVLDLKAKPTNELTESEWQYIMLKEEQCAQWQAKMAELDQYQSSREAVVLLWVAGVVVGGIALAAIIKAGEDQGR